jgi:threonine dehydratase
MVVTSSLSNQIVEAARRLEGHAVRTPLLRAPQLDGLVGRQVWLKDETRQVTRSFKFRGAFNRLTLIPQAKREAGVVAWSSGNHAQAVAEAGRRLGIAVTVVMPADAPAVKRDATLALGAEIVPYDRISEDREAIARGLVAQRGATLVPSYDDWDVIAGQGTVGLEIAQACAVEGIAPTDVVVCCGGGGLVAGCAAALADWNASVRVWTAEPQAFDDHRRSFAAGEPLPVTAGQNSICDALLAPRPGELTWTVNRHLVAGGLAASDERVLEAMALLYQSHDIVAEPGGAIAVACAIAGGLKPDDAPAVLVVSGGNVDEQAFPVQFRRQMRGGG